MANIGGCVIIMRDPGGLDVAMATQGAEGIAGAAACRLRGRAVCVAVASIALGQSFVPESRERMFSVAQMSAEAKELLAPLFTASGSKLTVESVERFIKETELIDCAFELDEEKLFDNINEEEEEGRDAAFTEETEDGDDSAAELSEMSSSSPTSRPSSAKPPQSPRTPGRSAPVSPGRRLKSLLEYKSVSFEADISADGCFQAIISTSYDDTSQKIKKSPGSIESEETVPRLDFDSSDSGLLSSPLSSSEPRGDEGGTDGENADEMTNRSKKMSASVEQIPRFYFPFGKPISPQENDAVLEQVRLAFLDFKDDTIYRPSDLAEICKAINVPLYWKRPLYDAIAKAGGYNFYRPDNSPPIGFKDFVIFWREMTSKCHDEASRFVFTLAAASEHGRFTASRIRNYILPSDFVTMMKDLIDTHPGLSFLTNATNFHESYVDTVIGRIFWTVNRSWSGKITALELRKSNLLQTIRLLDTIEDINKLTDFFSYEHFYVIYCSFWDIDKDHDMLVTRQELMQYSSNGITPRIADRIFSGAVTRGAKGTRLERIGFNEFIAFILAEEDKRNPASIEYWFRCLDLDGDGVISLYEMEYFYEDVENKMIEAGYETMAFTDVACNLLDMVAPAQPNCVTLRDLKNCALAHRFINTLVNMTKYYEQESSEGDRDSQDDSGISDWDRFCIIEYKNQSENDSEFEDDDESDSDD